MKKKKNKYTDYIFIILLILNGGTIIKILGHTALLQILSALFMFFLLFINGKLYVNKTGGIIFFLILSFLVINLFHFFQFNLSSFINNQVINFITLILIGVFVGNQFLYRTESFVIKLSLVLKIVIIHAIISCLLLSLFPSKQLLFQEVSGGSGYVGDTLIFFQRTNLMSNGNLDDTMNSILGFNFYRAHGIFWEPGVFATFVNIYVFINFFVFKNTKVIRLAVPALLLSWSTAGLSVFLLQSIIYFLEYKKGLNQSFFKKYIIGSVVFAIVFSISLDNFSSKLSGDSKGSAAQRFTDTMGAISVIKDNAIFGVGVEFENLKNQMKNASVVNSGFLGNSFKSANKGDVKFSNSFLLLFVYFGLIIGLILVYALLHQTLIPNKKWLFFLITILSLSSSPILFLGFHFTFIISGLRNTIPFFKLNDKPFVLSDKTVRRFIK